MKGKPINSQTKQYSQAPTRLTCAQGRSHPDSQSATLLGVAAQTMHELETAFLTPSLSLASTMLTSKPGSAFRTAASVASEEGVKG